MALCGIARRANSRSRRHHLEWTADLPPDCGGPLQARATTGDVGMVRRGGGDHSEHVLAGPATSPGPAAERLPPGRSHGFLPIAPLFHAGHVHVFRSVHHAPTAAYDTAVAGRHAV